MVANDGRARRLTMSFVRCIFKGEDRCKGEWLGGKLVEHRHDGNVLTREGWKSLRPLHAQLRYTFILHEADVAGVSEV